MKCKCLCLRTSAVAASNAYGLALFLVYLFLLRFLSSKTFDEISCCHLSLSLMIFVLLIKPDPNIYKTPMALGG